MKIFNRGADASKAAPAGPAAPAAPAPAPAALPAPPPAAPAGPDITTIIDANVKEMSEKIARLATTVEGGNSERAEFESKIQQMEERMRKLSALTEMISAQYNPFVGSAPAESEPMPLPEIGLAMPPSPVVAPMGPAAAAAAPPPVFDIPLPAPEPAHAAPAPAYDPPAPAHPPAYEPPAEAAPQPQPQPSPAWSELAPSYAFDDFDATPDEAPAPAPGEGPGPSAEDVRGVRLWAAKPGFASSMLLLNWADTLLKHAPSRASFAQLLEYYHNIGWIGDPARDQLLAYADGLAHAGAPDADVGEWRASVDVHERSLLYLEKLRAIAEGRNAES
jgi:hypothetical protein